MNHIDPMHHLSEEQLVLHLHGDADDSAAIQEHLAACEACRASYAALKLVLAAVDAAPVPERAQDYERRVWQRIEPQLTERLGWDWRALFQPRRLAFAGAMAALLILAFLAGRIGWPTPAPITQPVAGLASPQVRERILLVAVGDHLERSQMVLVELVNTRPDGLVNIAAEQHRAEELVAANRLYRQTAATAGDAAVASVLEDLERVLLEIARSPSEINSVELAALQRRIEARGILFKVRVLGSHVREKSSEPLRPGQGRS